MRGQGYAPRRNSGVPNKYVLTPSIAPPPKLHRAPEVGPVPGLTLGIVQGSLLFFNCDNVKAQMREIAASLPRGARWFVLDAGAIAQVDSTGAAMPAALHEELDARGLALGLAELSNDARVLLKRAGVIERIDSTMVFHDVSDALRAFIDSEGTTRQPNT